MRTSPRLFPSGLSRRERRSYRAVLLFFVVALAALLWPVYPLFGGIRPMVLGMPFSLYYVTVWLVGSFLVLLGVFLWEGRRGAARGRRPEDAVAGGEDRGPGRPGGPGATGAEGSLPERGA